MSIRPNRVKEKLAQGEMVFIAAGLSDPDLVDEFGPAGFDGMWLESEHGPVDFGDISDLTRACDIWGMTSIVRVNQNDQGVIYRAFDRGVQGLVVPHVNTRAEAENVVAGGKFAPIGQRGLYGSRQSFGVPDYLHVANDHTLLVILLEDIIAMNNLDEILEVDHIDVFFVAPSDLAASMGHLGNNDHPEVQKTIDDALARIQDRGRVAGTTTNNETVAKYAAAGVQMLLTPVVPWLVAGANQFRNRAAEARGSR